MPHFHNGSTHRSYWFKPDNNPLSHLCYVAVSAWYAPGNAIIAKIPIHYLPRRYVTWLPKLQENSKCWFEKNYSKPLHIHKQLLIASCFWKCLTHITDGNIYLDFIGSQPSIPVSWHSAVFHAWCLYRFNVIWKSLRFSFLQWVGKKYTS